MANKILSFEEYSSKTASPQVEETQVEDLKAKEMEAEEEEIESEEEEEIESSEESDDDEVVSEMLKKCYESACKEAVAYEGDDYTEHTIESYLKENAALCASLGADALEKAHGQVREGELTVEMYEASCNEMKEAFIKKIDEVKEAYSAK